ncbi:MAG: DNA replication/repair protein RecF [Stappiaceae bacterium]
MTDAYEVEKVSLSALKLTDFRNYSSLHLTPDDKHVVLVGSNGAGKTNILEALSFLSPGRGLRRAGYDEVGRNGGPGSWAIAATIEGAVGSNQIGTGLTLTPDGPDRSRKTRLNGATARNLEQLSEFIRVLWLTPAMDGLFMGPASDRRRFLDRLVLAIDPQHGRRVNAFDKAMRSRNKLLEERTGETGWLEGLEIQLAEHGVAIAMARAELIACFSNLIERQEEASSNFPKAHLLLQGELEREIEGLAATDAEDHYRSMLQQMRARDTAAGRTLIGPHRADLQVRHIGKNMEAARSSTGEQKALLLGLVLAHARLVASLSGMTPVLLLDEVAAHLDAERRAALFDQLDALGGQCWLTGTDRAYFTSLGSRAQIFNVQDGHVLEEPLNGH